jgi:hypothetical protein
MGIFYCIECGSSQETVKEPQLLIDNKKKNDIQDSRNEKLSQFKNSINQISQSKNTQMLQCGEVKFEKRQTSEQINNLNKEKAEIGNKEKQINIQEQIYSDNNIQEIETGNQPPEQEPIINNQSQDQDPEQNKENKENKEVIANIIPISENYPQNEIKKIKVGSVKSSFVPLDVISSATVNSKKSEKKQNSEKSKTDLNLETFKTNTVDINSQQDSQKGIDSPKKDDVPGQSCKYSLHTHEPGPINNINEINSNDNYSNYNNKTQDADIIKKMSINSLNPKRIINPYKKNTNNKYEAQESWKKKPKYQNINENKDEKDKNNLLENGPKDNERRQNKNQNKNGINDDEN